MVSGQNGPVQQFNPDDARASIAERTLARDQVAADEKRQLEYLTKYDKLAQIASGNISPEERAALEAKRQAQNAKDRKEVFMFAGIMIASVCVLCVAVVYGILYLTEYMEEQNQKTVA